MNNHELQVTSEPWSQEEAKSLSTPDSVLYAADKSMLATNGGINGMTAGEMQNPRGEDYQNKCICQF